MGGLFIAPSRIHGLGVFASRDYAPGERVLVIDDHRIVDDQHPLQPDLGERDIHCDYLAGGLVVLMQSPERYINSSCEPNTYVKTVAGSRRVIARRVIYYGDEITYDYLINCHGGEVWNCRCGSPKCRKTIPSSYFDLPIEDQIANLPYVDTWFLHEHLKPINHLLTIMLNSPSQIKGKK
jgi:SET domain-containing protein